MTKTVLQKLGFKPGVIGWAVKRPVDLEEIDLPDRPADAVAVELIVAFVASTSDIEERLAHVLPHYQRGGSLWFAYPKKSGAIKTDISRDHGWEPLAAYDLLPVTQVALNETWSALRFRYRDEIARLTRKSDLPGKRAA